MRVIVTFSGGKDSLAALLWTREHITKNFTTVFCDTGWEHPLTYEYIHRIADNRLLAVRDGESAGHPEHRPASSGTDR